MNVRNATPAPRWCLVAAAAWAAPASAQMAPGQVPPCGPRAIVIEQLARDFGEVVVSRGLASNGTMLELLVSPQGTWTMLISLPNGHSCFGAAGEMWEAVEPRDKGRKS